MLNWWLRQGEAGPAVAPSLLAADFTCLREEIADMQAAGADLLHLDVMDGHFVPNITFGPFITSAIRRCSALPLDAHLMIRQPERYLEDFAAAGSDAITIHVEAPIEVAKVLGEIEKLGLKRGLSLNPGTDVRLVRPYLELLDLVLVMSVQPGFGGQSFQTDTVQKIAELKSLRESNNYRYAISVDGGINERTGAMCRDAGADVLVAGTYLFRAGDKAEAIRSLRPA